MGIKVKCKLCKEKYEFPNCPDAKTNHWEAFAFGLYTIIGNESINNIWKCHNCKNKN